MTTWVNSSVGVPPLISFTSTQGQGSPLCVDTASGLLYYLFPGNVVGSLNFPSNAPLALNNHLLLWGNAGGITWDGVSDTQAVFTQNQPTFLTNGSLGALYAQRLNTYTGGATSDLTTPTCGAVRGYNQIQTTVTYCNEAGGLFVTDNFSWLGQATGVYGQANSYHGGRTFGLEAEGVEHSESFTATAGQTTFAIPNGYSANQAIVTKNGTLLTRTTDYADTSGTNIVLTAGATAGDTIKVYRGDPQFAQQGGEVTVFGAGGTDNNNTFSGNRIGLSIYGWRQDATTTHQIHIGSILNLVANPADSNLIADRGINFRGRFDRAIDFTAADFTASTWFIKFTSTSGVDASGNIIPKSSTVASLPAASTALKGVRIFATDLSGAAYTYGTSAAGGGTRGAPVFCDGAAWREG